MKQKSIKALLAFLPLCVLAHGSGAKADLQLTILQTSDIHSHFTGRDNPYGLGGLARLAAKINEIRAKTSNVLLLDAGDFTEGTIFFTLGSGETTERLLETMHYDALVLGNHDWLIGPGELFNSLSRADFKSPILSANLDTSALAPEVTLNHFIKPYIVKDVNGVKVGIFGLSTFQLIFDSFFKPVRILEPTKVASQIVDQLRNVEGCKIVIALTHLGINADEKLAKNVAGIDLIVGGHTHLLLRHPEVVNGIPIVHVGKWGEFLGQTDLNYNNGRTQLTNYTLHRMDGSVPQDPGMKALVEGAVKQIESSWGHVFDDKIIHSDVDLPIQSVYSESEAGNWAADAILGATDAEVSFENPTYSARDLFRGDSNTADIFNAFPHIFNPSTGRTWTVKTFELSGFFTKLLMAGIYRTGLSLRLGNAKVVLDLSKTLDQISSVEVGGQPMNDFRNYKIAGTQGIIAVFDFLKSYGIDLGVTDIQDTGREAWVVIRDALVQKSPITFDKIKWEGRVRTLQPDLTLRPEEFQVSKLPNGDMDLAVTVRNAGMTASAATLLKASYSTQLNDFLASKIRLTPAGGLTVAALQPGESVIIHLPWTVTNMGPGRYSMSLEIDPVDGELETRNNKLDTYIDLH